MLWKINMYFTGKFDKSSAKRNICHRYVGYFRAQPSSTVRKCAAVSFNHCEELGKLQKLLKAKQAWCVADR